MAHDAGAESRGAENRGRKPVPDDRSEHAERAKRGEAREEESGWEHRGEISGAKLVKKRSSVWLATENHFYIWVLLEALQISVVCSRSS